MKPETPNPTVPAPADRVSPSSCQLWDRLVVQYDLDPAALELLTNALLQRDIAMRAEAELRPLTSLTVIDRYQQEKPHPLLAIQRDAHRSFMQHIRALGIDLEPVGEPGGQVA